MKTFMIIGTIAALAFATMPASAENMGSAKSGMGSAEAALIAKGNVKGADRIARAKCFSGTGACNAKYGALRARAQARVQR
jgi:hypothetical protein